MHCCVCSLISTVQRQNNQSYFLAENLFRFIKSSHPKVIYLIWTYWEQGCFKNLSRFKAPTCSAHEMRKSVETCGNSTLKLSQCICCNFIEIALNNTISSWLLLFVQGSEQENCFPNTTFTNLQDDYCKHKVFRSAI